MSAGAPTRPRTRITSLAVLIAAALALVWSWSSLVSRPGDRSWLGPEYRRSTAHGRPLPIEFARGPAGLVARPWAVHQQPWPDGVTPLDGVCVFQDMPRRFGVWALTREVVQVMVLGAEQLSPVELTQVQPVTLRAIDSMEDGPQLFARSYNLLSRGVWSETRVLWGGYIHNAFAMLPASILVAGTGLWLMGLWKGERARRRVQAGLCPQCRYPLPVPAARCSECGRASEASDYDRSGASS